MDCDASARALMAQLNGSPFATVVQFCGNDRQPGLNDVPEWQVWADRDTTADQARIEEYLQGVVTRSSSIFHVGIGNSSLARRFAYCVSNIFGITLHHEEKALADSLNIPNYATRVINKFSRTMVDVHHGFDFIVDNNPSGFSCCLFHFCRMMVVYKEMLQTHGALLTDELGLSWVVTGGDPAWTLNWEDWIHLGKALAMIARKTTPSVYALVKTSPESDGR